MNLEEKVKELESELEKYKMRVKELEAELEKRKKKMPKGGNTHRRPFGLVDKDLSNGHLSRVRLVSSLKVFMSKVDKSKVDKNGRGYTDWKKAMEYARKDKYIKKYAKAAGVQITARNLERWYKHYVTHEIQLNTSKR